MNAPRKQGRPSGSTSKDDALAKAFGAAVVTLRGAAGISQEALAALAGVERSHMGKLERGKHMPNLAAFIKIAQAMGYPASALMDLTEAELARHLATARPATSDVD